jgi:hypothetical protein
VADVIAQIAAVLTQGAYQVVSVLADPPNPAPQPIPGMGPVADMFLGWGKWALLVGGVLGMFICGGMMILGRRNRSSTAVDGATGIPWVLGGLTLGAVGAAVVGVVLK